MKLIVTINSILAKRLPEPAKRMLRPLKNRLFDKHDSEFAYWKRTLENGNGISEASDYYRKYMLAIAGESNEDFLNGRIVADFGCGPRGSLAWANSALLRIGIDVLADRYADEFKERIISHQMVYVKSTERVIPLPSDFVDVMFTLNAMDHVDSFPEMCREIMRVLKPGAVFIGSFNLEVPISRCEPQRLDEKTVEDHLLRFLEVESYRLAGKGPKDNLYAPFFEGNLFYEQGREGFLWVRARKPQISEA